MLGSFSHVDSGTLVEVVLLATLTAIATGVGALPLLVVRNVGERVLGICGGVAAGVMIAASYGLVAEGVGISAWKTAAGALGGLAFMYGASRWMHRMEERSPGLREAFREHGGRAAILVLALMFVHSIPEGVGIGVAYGEGEKFGAVMALAIAVHNIPEGLAIALTMVPAGVSIGRAFWWAVFTSIPQPLMAVPAYLFVTAFLPTLPAGLGFAGGGMLLLSIVVLLPESFEAAGKPTVILWMIPSFVAMVAFQSALGVAGV